MTASCFDPGDRRPEDDPSARRLDPFVEPVAVGRVLPDGRGGQHLDEGDPDAAGDEEIRRLHPHIAGAEDDGGGGGLNLSDEKVAGVDHPGAVDAGDRRRHGRGAGGQDHGVRLSLAQHRRGHFAVKVDLHPPFFHRADRPVLPLHVPFFLGRPPGPRG